MMRPSGKKLAFEVLERRDLLTIGDFQFDLPFAGTRGNVTAEVIDGTLIIRGDGASNAVGVYEAGDHVFYLQSPNGLSTINGQNTWILRDEKFDVVVMADVTKGIEIDMGDGDDWVELNGSELPDATIITGAGDDTILIDGNYISFSPFVETRSIKFPRPATIEGNLILGTGDGNDLLTLFVNVKGDVTIATGAGDDSLLEPRYSMYGVEIHEVMRVEGRKAFDLGSDEGETIWPADWRSDAGLAQKVHPAVVAAFELYAAARQAGQIRPGEEWTVPLDDGRPAAHFTADGRLQIEFTYHAGDTQLIDRLAVRGLTVERHSDGNGLAHALIRESDLALFGNLPAIAGVYVRGMMWGQVPFEFDPTRVPADVDASGSVNSNDALIVINALNVGNNLPLYARTDVPSDSHLDVNRDGLLTAIDALRVINVLIRLSNSMAGGSQSVVASAEGESSVAPVSFQEQIALSADEFFSNLGASRRAVSWRQRTI